jgi:hypothetical protein
MNRRDFITGLGAATLAHAAPSTEVHVRIDPGRTKGMVAGMIPSDFLGLGYEISSVAVQGLLAPENRRYIQLVRTLSSEGVIRIGGNTSDFSSWSPGGQALSLPKGTVTNTASIDALGGFLRATGWKLIWGLNLGTGTAESAADQAAAVARAAGDRLLCFEIGNEPDLFARSGHRPQGYGYAEYLQDYRRFKEALLKRVPSAPLAGPDVAGAPDWVTSFVRDEGRNIKLLTEHYYRTGEKNPAATIANLLNTDDRFLKMTGRLLEDSRESGVPYRLCELNSFSGGGKPGVSDTFASTLWGLDLMFTLATAGGSGINWETGLNQLGFVSSYSPIFEDDRGNFSARPLYYALLAFSRSGKGRLVDTQNDTQNDAAASNFKSWATIDNSGRLSVILINKDVTANARAQLSVPGKFSIGEVSALTAPAIDSKTGISFAGAEVSTAGTWRAAKRRRLHVTSGALSVEVPAASAAIIALS